MKILIPYLLGIAILFVPHFSNAYTPDTYLDKEGYLRMKWPVYSNELKEQSKKDKKAYVDLAVCYGLGRNVKPNEKLCYLMFNNLGFSVDYNSDLGLRDPYASLWWGIFLWEMSTDMSVIKKLKWNKELYLSKVYPIFYEERLKELGIRYMELAAEAGFEYAQLQMARSNRCSIRYSCYGRWNNKVRYDKMAGYYELVCEWYTKASENGNPHIIYEFGNYLDQLIGYGCNTIPDIYNLALYCRRKAAENGHVISTRCMGDVYSKGYYYQSIDTVKAMEWYRKAIEINDTVSFYSAGKILFSQRSPEAVEILEQGIQMDNGNCAYLLGDMYSKGIIVEKDCKKAFDLYKQSSELGSPGGQYGLGTYYEDGICCEKDDKKAAELYSQSLKNKSPFPDKKNAAMRLAKMYEEGRGVFLDAKRANYYYNLANQYK